jgi:hypothetical protein
MDRPSLAYDDAHWRALLRVIIDRIGLERFQELIADALDAPPETRARRTTCPPQTSRARPDPSGPVRGGAPSAF